MGFSGGQGDAVIGRARGLALHHGSTAIVVATIVTFGSMRVGGSKTRNSPIRNAGGADVEVFGIEGVASPFSLISPTFPQTVPPGGELPVRLRFSPTATGSVQQMITVHSNDPDMPSLDVLLTGSGKRR